MSIPTKLFPFPHAVDGEMRSGSIQDWPERCRYCRTKECLSPANTGIQICQYGFNYQRVDPHIVIAGVVVRDFPQMTPARVNRMRQNRDHLIKQSALDGASSALRLERSRADALVGTEKDNLIQEYIRKEQFKTDFLKQLQPEIQKGLSFVHDYKQVNTQISQNINVVIETRYSGASFEEKLAHASQEEKSIYEASKYLEEKLKATKFLMHPEWLDRSDDCVWFRFHGLIHKYIKIYSPRFESKGVSITTAGESFAKVFANPTAVAVIPHTFIDNAAKYTSKSTWVEVTTQDEKESIRFSVSSYGPRILKEEKEAIFQPFYRGQYAQKVEEEGAGFGLYISQLVAKRHLGCEISVNQDSQETRNLGFWTTFLVQIPLTAIVASRAGGARSQI